MNSCIITAKKVNITNTDVQIEVALSSNAPFDCRRVSACFFCENDSRIIPMSLTRISDTELLASGVFDIPYLFYTQKRGDSIDVKFLCSTSDGQSEILAPKSPITIKAVKRNRLAHFIKCSKKEKSKIILQDFMSLLFLPYRHLRVQPNKITFLSNRSDRLSGNIKAVFHEMTKLDGVDITVMCKKGGISRNYKNIFKFFKLYATSRIVFVDDYYHLISYVKKKDDVLLIQLWHACGAFKTFGFSRLGKDSFLDQSSPNHRQYDYVVVSSGDVVPYYAEGFGVDMKKVIPLGSARCDCLTDEKYKSAFKKKFYKEHPQLLGKKLILFAPTFRGGGLGSCYYPVEKFETDKILSQLDEDYCIAYKMHPYLKERPSFSQNYSDRVFDFTLEYDINDLLFVTDVLITDYSSVIFEASVVDVPMLFFAFDLKEYSAERDFYCSFESFVPGKIVYTTDELAGSICKRDFKQELVCEFRQKYFGSTSGHATENVIEFTKKLLNQDGK